MSYGRYQITRVLGEGSMGVVYLAHDPKIDRPVALKVLRPDRLSNETFVKRFLKEAKAIGRLSHPSIVTIYDVGEDAQTIYIAMELLDGKPLNEIVRAKSFSTEEIIDLGIQVSEALDYAHQKGIVHRDIKPSNIVLSSQGRIKITDFGIAHIDDPDATQATQLGEILGTPAYMSPEQVLGQPADGRSDLFSLGVILYELAAGSRPFKGENIATIFRSITDASPQEPSGVCPGIPGELSATIMKCLQKKPEARYSSGNELCEALRRCRTKIAASTIALPAREAKPRALKAVFVAGVVLIFAAGIWGARTILKTKPFSTKPPQSTSTSAPASTPAPGPSAASTLPPTPAPATTEAVTPPPTPAPPGIPSPTMEKEPVSSLPPAATHATEGQPAAPGTAGEGRPSALASIPQGREGHVPPSVAPESIAPQPAQYTAGFKAFYLDNNRKSVELKDADSLTAGDFYYLTFTPKHQLFLYIAQIDSAGSISWIFPNREFSSRNNPVTPEALYRFPERDYFGVDATRGKENILVVASTSRIKELDDISKGIGNAEGPENKRWTLEFKQIFNKQHPNTIKEISFLHK